MTIHAHPPRVHTADLRRVQPPLKSAAAWYGTPAHRKWRRAVIERAKGRCQDPECIHPHRRGITLFADHIVEIQDSGALLDLANGIALCGSCHSRKTHRERAKRMGIARE